MGFLDRFKEGMNQSIRDDLPQALLDNKKKYEQTGEPKYAQNVTTYAAMAMQMKDAKDVQLYAEIAMGDVLTEVRRRACIENVEPETFARSQGLDVIADGIKEALAGKTTAAFGGDDYGRKGSTVSGIAVTGDIKIGSIGPGESVRNIKAEGNITIGTIGKPKA